MYTYLIDVVIFGLVGFLIGKIIVKVCHLDKKNGDDDRRTK